jgi:hypothetical protein
MCLATFNFSYDIRMKILYTLQILILLALTSCTFEEEPILLISPTADISAHIKNQKIYATVIVNVNPQVLSAGNIPTVFQFTGELAIYNTVNGNIIDSNTFSGGGLSQAYTVSADTSSHDRFIVIASGTIDAFADIGNDGESENDKLVSTGDFYQEAQFVVSDLVIPSQQ